MAFSVLLNTTQYQLKWQINTIISHTLWIYTTLPNPITYEMFFCRLFFGSLTSLVVVHYTGTESRNILDSKSARSKVFRFDLYASAVIPSVVLKNNKPDMFPFFAAYISKIIYLVNNS